MLFGKNFDSCFVRRAMVFTLALFVTACAGGEPPSPQPAPTAQALLSPTVATDAANYQAGATITVTYAGLPGNPHDWIAIAPAGSANSNFILWVYTDGQTGGTATFAAPANGSYVARAFLNDTFTLAAESPTFTVGPAISTDRTTYAPGATVTVTYAGLPGNVNDWIAIAPAGAPNNSFVAWMYTSGQMSGTATFTAPAAGSYVARAFLNDTFELLTESAPFTIAVPTVSTDKGTYAPGDTVTVTYAALPGNQKDWIAIALAGSENNNFVQWVYTNGQINGTATFTAPGVGSYVARAFLNDTPTLLAQSATFTVAAPAISTDGASYAPGATVTVTYSGLPGNLNDWIAIAPAGSANSNFVAFVYTNGQTSGTATFTAPAAGSYVARAFLNDTFTLIVESASFTVETVAVTISTDQSSYAPGATITVTYAGLPGNQHDWIAIAPAGSASSSFVSWTYTNGATSGTATFAASTSGLYVARSFINDTFDLAAQSAVFTVCGDEGGLLCFVANLTGLEEVPANASTATGSGVFVFNPATREISYQVQHTVVGATAAHIHQAPATMNGSVIVPFALVGQGASGSAILTEGQATDLQSGGLYANVHSPTFPGGEIRGQIMRPGNILFVAHLNGAQEVGPTPSTATGTGSVIFDPATNGIIYRMQHTVVGASAGHIHQAPAGMNGGVIVPFNLVGQGASGVATLTAAMATALQAAGTYMNVHSPTFPNGEIRGQLLRPGM